MIENASWAVLAMFNVNNLPFIGLDRFNSSRVLLANSGTDYINTRHRGSKTHYCSASSTLIRSKNNNNKKTPKLNKPKRQKEYDKVGNLQQCCREGLEQL